ncbi:alpha/beta hydrolase [Pengzhenrongella sicca]|uniref:Alpha/beta fold hydrolase n=1 Tax=Pengzhenrongella sicca TaxID=2819238 RepID=A0A8A4ZGJ2_9MICO|nr:alpha/beta fold hydrolase [Pengzhenrongella sicca]QTE30501.1 alpha/beta fold hydrolase [Pengzhenrongella sicca]
MWKTAPLLIATLATAALLASCTAAGESSKPSGSPTEAVMTTPRDTLESLEPCRDLPELPTARCGSVTVPLDRHDPDSATTTVAFALVPRTDASTPGLGTIVPNPGGPGTSAIDATGALFAEALAPLMDRRDVLLVDPRGVGRSDALTCGAVEGAELVFGSVQDQRTAVGECGRQLGDRVDDYGTTAVADDIESVRLELGIDKLDLLGISYGTYLMPVYAERHPDHVRTITMAGAYSVNDDPTGAVGAAAFRRAVTLACASAGTCSGETVLADLATLAEQLRARPDAVQVTYDGTTHDVVVDEWQLASVAGRVFSNVPDPDGLTALAESAAAAKSGDLEPLRAFVAASLTATADIASAGPDVVSVAQSWATICHDYPRSFDYADSVEARKQAHAVAQAELDDNDFAPFSASAWTTRADYDNGGCLEWPNDPTAQAPFAKGAQLPDVPVLVLSGDLDANTPSASGREAAAQFPNATFVEIPGAGHTPAVTAEGGEKILTFIAEGES